MSSNHCQFQCHARGDYHNEGRNRQCFYLVFCTGCKVLDFVFLNHNAPFADYITVSGMIPMS